MNLVFLEQCSWKQCNYLDGSLDYFVRCIDQVTQDTEGVDRDMGPKLRLANIPFVGDTKKHLQGVLDYMAYIASDMPVLVVRLETVVD